MSCVVSPSPEVAYIWMALILSAISPDIVELWEAPRLLGVPSHRSAVLRVRKHRASRIFAVRDCRELGALHRRAELPEEGQASSRPCASATIFNRLGACDPPLRSKSSAQRMLPPRLGCTTFSNGSSGAWSFVATHGLVLCSFVCPASSAQWTA